MCTLKDVSTVRLLGLKLNAFRFFFQILFQSALLQVQSYIHFFFEKIYFFKKERKKEKQHINIFVILYYDNHKFVDITFNEIGLVARRTKGCNSSFEGKVFRTNKK